MKRIINIVLIVALMLQLAVAGVNAADYVQNSQNYKTLVNMGMVPPIADEKLQMVDSISRGDFAQIIANILMKGEKVDQYTDTPFSDVIPGTDEANAISLVYEKGIMVGNDDFTFGVDMGITYREAVKTLVVLMGYEKQALNEGGYPDGYLRIASNTGLTKGIAVVEEEFINYEDFFKLMLNLSESPVMSITFDSINKGKTVYSVDEDEDFLYKFFDISYGKGIITANSVTALEGNGAGEGMLEINGEPFMAGDSDAEAYLGYNVKYYYHYDKALKENVIDYVIPDKKNDVVTVYSDQLERVEVVEQSRKIKLYYYQDEEAKKEEKLTVDNGVSVIVNSRYTSDFTPETFMPESGSVTLIDNNNDGEYDVAFIETCDIIIVDTVGEYYGFITDKYRKNPDGTQYKAEVTFKEPGTVVIKKNGIEVTPKEINPFDVVAIYKSTKKGNDYFEIIVTANSINATVRSYDGDKAIIDGKAYKLNKIYERYLKETGKMLPIGSRQTFYLDHNGLIAGMKENQFDRNYGFVRKAYIPDTEEIVEMRIYNVQNDEWVTLRCTDNVKIDGTKAEEEGLLQLKGEVIRYELNYDGEISRIYMPEKFKSGAELMQNDNVGGLGENRGNGTHYYRSGNTLTLKIPKAQTDFDIEDAYSNSYGVWHQGLFTVDLYDMDGYIIGLEVYRVNYTADSNVSVRNPSMIVTKISTGMNADDAVVGKIEGITNGYAQAGGILSEACTESPAFKSLEEGDLIRYETNGRGEIDVIAIDVDASEARKTQVAGGGSLHTDLFFRAGAVEAVDVANNILAVRSEEILHTVRIPDCIVIMNTTGSKTRFERAYKGDLSIGQRVIFRGGAYGMTVLEILN